MSVPHVLLKNTHNCKYTSRLLSSFRNLGVGDRARKWFVTLVAASGSSRPGQEIDGVGPALGPPRPTDQMVALPPDLTGRHLETGGQFRDSVPGPQAPSLTTGKFCSLRTPLPPSLKFGRGQPSRKPDTPSSSQRVRATSAKTQRVLIMSPDHDFAEGVQHLN
ncbi:hypothetical protein Bbelb_019430 [Branchiostoma belcheri]|nr:hypothetical protein Bbelb_019430 [Branchiostoma belcheri]